MIRNERKQHITLKAKFKQQSLLTKCLRHVSHCLEAGLKDVLRKSGGRTEGRVQESGDRTEGRATEFGGRTEGLRTTEFGGWTEGYAQASGGRIEGHAGVRRPD